MSPFAKSWSARRGCRLWISEQGVWLSSSRETGLMANANWPYWQRCQGCGLNFLRPAWPHFRFLLPKLAPNCAPSLGGNTICKSTVRGTQYERKKIHLIGMGGWESWWYPEAIQSLSSEKCTLSPCIVSFLLVGKDKASAAKPPGLHMLSRVNPAVDQRKWGGSLVHHPDELVPAYKISIFLSAQAGRTHSIAPFTLPRKSWSKGCIVPIYLHLLPSNWPSPKALRQGQRIALVRRSQNGCFSPHYVLL